jgi:hypothetical protein
VRCLYARGILREAPAPFRKAHSGTPPKRPSLQPKLMGIEDNLEEQQEFPGPDKVPFKKIVRWGHARYVIKAQLLSIGALSVVGEKVIKSDFGYEQTGWTRSVIRCITHHMDRAYEWGGS